MSPRTTGKTLVLGIWFAAFSSGALAQLRLGTPDTINVIKRGTGDSEDGCGLSADYTLTEMVLRVEIMTWRRDGGGAFTIRTFSPSSVTPPMRDIWLKTPTYFSLGLFKDGRITSKGFMESRGELDTAASRTLINELASGRAEISLVFDGPLPHSRVPVALPEPLPPEIRNEFETCVSGWHAN